MAKTETIVDGFTTSIDSGVWGGAGTGVTWVDDGDGSGHVECSVDTSVRSLYTATTYDVTSSYVFAKVDFGATGNGTKQNSFEISDNQTSGTNRARFYWTGTNMRCVIVTGGSEVGSPTDVTYNATDHAWLRFREASGTLYWDTSPDGSTWTQRHSQSIPTWGTNLTAIYPRIRAFRSGTESASVVKFDNVNSVPGTGTNANAEVATGTATGNGVTPKVSPTSGNPTANAVANIALTYEPVPISTLTLAMDDTEQYSASSGITRTGASATLPATTDYKHLWSNDASLGLTDSSLSAKITPTTGTGRQYFMTVELDNFDSNNQLRFQLDDTTLYAYSVDGGSTTEVHSAAYNATNHAWWRIRHDTGTGLIYWEVSADGSSWSTFDSNATPAWNIASVGARWIAGRFAGTDGSMLVESVNVGSIADAPAENASGAATGNTAQTKISPPAGPPAGTAVGNDAGPKVAPNAGLPGGVAQSEQPTTKVSTNLTALTADASVPQTSVRISVPTSQGTGQGTANDPKPSVGPQPPEGAATGTAYQPTTTVRASAQVATGVGTAHNISPDNDAPAGIGLGAASALDPSVSISSNVTAETASGSYVATDAHTTVRTHADVAGGSAPGLDAKPSVKPSAGIPTGSAVGEDSTTRVKPTSETASGVATTNTGAAHVAPSATLPVGSATVLDTSARVGPVPSPASGAGTAQISGASASPRADLATGTGTAPDAQVFTSVGPEAGSGAGTGTAFDARALTVDDAAVPPARPSGWEQWAAIVAEGRQMVAFDRSQTPISCPQCGGQLDSLNGIQHCSFDGWLSRS